MELLAEDNIGNFNNALIQVPFSGGKGGLAEARGPLISSSSLTIPTLRVT